MPRPARPWFRFYVEALSDRKLRRMDPALRWVWLGVLGLARMSPSPGVLLVSEGEPADEHDLADVAGVTVRLARQALGAFEKSGMVSLEDDRWVVTNWSARQFESDDITERTRKYRSKERSNEVRGNAPESEAETDTEPPPSSSSSDLGLLPTDLWTTMADKKAAKATIRSSAAAFKRKCIENDKADGELVARALWLHERFNLSTSHLADCLIGGTTPRPEYQRREPA